MTCDPKEKFIFTKSLIFLIWPIKKKKKQISAEGQSRSQRCDDGNRPEYSRDQPDKVRLRFRVRVKLKVRVRPRFGDAQQRKVESLTERSATTNSLTTTAKRSEGGRTG